MIKPNFDLMLWMIFIGWIIKGIMQIALGVAGTEKGTKYDGLDVVAGLIHITLIIWVLFA